MVTVDSYPWKLTPSLSEFRKVKFDRSYMSVSFFCLFLNWWYETFLLCKNVFSRVCRDRMVKNRKYLSLHCWMYFNNFCSHDIWFSLCCAYSHVLCEWGHIIHWKFIFLSSRGRESAAFHPKVSTDLILGIVIYIKGKSCHVPRSVTVFFFFSVKLTMCDLEPWWQSFTENKRPIALNNVHVETCNLISE